jgi:aspartate/methionine/tyrosine aminotransferase
VPLRGGFAVLDPGSPSASLQASGEGRAEVSSMILPINPRVAEVGSPPIPEAQGWLGRYGGARGPAIDLSQAAPGYPPPPELLRRLGEAAASADATRYAPIAGDAPLRDAYARHVSELYGASVERGEVAITAGCNLAFAMTAMLLAKAGDAVLLPTPWYFNHAMTLAMLGVEPRSLPCRAEAGFVPDPDEAEALIDERVRAVVLVTPNNPTGAVYPASIIARFAELCRRRGVWLILDETYRDFLPPSVDRAHDVFAGTQWREHVVGLYSFSKAYSIPGHRTGAVMADAGVIAQLAKILDSLQICPARPAQAALPWAIASLAEWREGNRAAINARAAAFGDAIARLPGWRVDSIGAYFAYLRHPFAGETASTVAERLAVERGVLALPGSYFGPQQDEHLRVAFANVDTGAIAGVAERLAGFAGG